VGVHQQRQQRITLRLQKCSMHLPWGDRQQQPKGQQQLGAPLCLCQASRLYQQLQLL
jgi:hypothetical protein